MESLLCRKIYGFFLWHLLFFAMAFNFYVSFFIPLYHYFYSHYQGFSNRDTIIRHVLMYLVKTNSEKNWHVPCLEWVREWCDKESYLYWTSSVGSDNLFTKNRYSLISLANLAIWWWRSSKISSSTVIDLCLLFACHVMILSWTTTMPEFFFSYFSNNKKNYWWLIDYI